MLGPTKRKQKRKEADAASTLMTLGETNENVLEEAKETPSGKDQRSIFRLPHNAVEKLQLIFVENEVPIRAVRESLSKQLGLEFEKVSKWFKNARYLALKVRKKTPVDFGDVDSLKPLREKKAKEAKKKLNSKNRVDMLEAGAKMERLCQIKNRVEKLRQSLLQLPCRRFGKTSATTSVIHLLFTYPWLK